MASPTVHTSVLVRDVSKIVADIIINDPRFAKTRSDELEDLAGSEVFHRALGKALAGRIDWQNVRERRQHPKHGKAKAA